MSKSPLTPRPHQQTAIENAVNHLSKNNRGKIIMACGTGKTLTALWITEAMKWDRVIIAVPTLYLEGQFMSEWENEMLKINMSHQFLVIGSDKTIDLSATTKEDDIERNLKNLKKSNHKVVVLTTYSSSAKFARVSKAVGLVWNAIIFDEAHRTAGFLKSFSAFLFNENIKAEKRLFLTATEKVVSSNLASTKITSMDDSEIYGEMIYNLSMAEAIKKKLLSDYELVSPVIEDHEVQRLIAKNEILSFLRSRSEGREAYLISAALTILKSIKFLNLKKVLTYHSSIARAVEFKKLIEEIALAINIKIDVFHASSHQSNKQKNKQIFNFINSPKAILTNAKLLSEGVDIAEIDSVAFVDPKYSVIDIIQALGRALRLSKTKDKAYLIIPLISNINTDFLDTDIIRKIIRALSSADDRIIAKMRTTINENNTSREGLVKILGTPKFISLLKMQEAVNILTWKEIGTLKYRSYEDARQWMIENNMFSYNLHKKDVWKRYVTEGIVGVPNLPFDIPRHPNYHYKDEWNGWFFFFGQEPFSYKEAKKWIKNNIPKGITRKEYMRLRKDEKVSHRVMSSRFYKSKGDWKGYSDFLGSNIIDRKRSLYTYEEAKAWLKENHPEVKNMADFKKLDKSNFPDQMPRSVYVVYKNKGSWISSYDFFGVKNAKNKARPRVKYWSYETARNWLKENHPLVQSYSAYRKLFDYNFPKRMPKSPIFYYKKTGEWISGEHFFRSKPFTYKEAKKWMSINHPRIKTASEFAKMDKSDFPRNIPKDTKTLRKIEGWKGWNDFLELEE